MSEETNPSGRSPDSGGPDETETGPSEQPARILVVAPQPFYGDRGTPIALRRVLEAASERGERVDLLTFPVGESIHLPGLRTFRVGTLFPIREVPIGLSLRKMFLDLLLIPSLLRLTRREKYRCIHALEEAGFLALIFKFWHGAPVLYDMQSSLPEQLSQNFLMRPALVQKVLCFFERWLIRGVDRIVCSAGLQDYVLRIKPSAVVQEWFFPAQASEFTDDELKRIRDDLDISSDSRVILYTGNFEPYQGLSRLIAAIPRVLVRVPKARFILVGGNASDFPDQFQEAGKFLGRGVLRLIRRQPQSVILRYLAVADVVVSPREFGRNIGLKVFDYMAAGKPIVATNSPPHRSVLNENRAVLVNLTPEDFSRGIIQLLEDPAGARRLGEAAKQYAETNLAWKTFVGQVADLYQPISATGHVRPVESTVVRPKSASPAGNGGFGQDE